MKKNNALTKGGTICGLGTLVTMFPSTLGLSAAVATPTVASMHHAQTVAFVSSAKPVAKKRVIKKAPVKKASGKSGTFVGQAAQTQYGPVQVSVTVSGGRITNVSTPVYPMGTGRDQSINSQAIPMLQQEVMQAQSSRIQGIGGASYTSQGFYTSLLSALAQAGHK